MFPIPWNFPLRKKNGNLVNIGDAIDAGTEIPEHTSSDEGKLLSVDENGDLEWSDEVNSEIQTLTNNLSDEVETRATLGAHNRASFDTPLGKAAYVGYTKTDTGVRITNSASATYSYQQFAIVLEKNTDYIVSFDITVTSGKGGVVIKGDNSANILVKGELNSGRVSYTFNSGEHSTWYFALYSTYASAALGDVLYANFMVRRASDLSTDFAPYAMTNRELTDFATLANRLVSDGVNRVIDESTLPSELTTGVYRFDSSRTTGLWVGYGVIVLTFKNSTPNGVQLAFKIGTDSDVSSNFVAYRLGYSNTWSNWAKLSGTNVS